MTRVSTFEPRFVSEVPDLLEDGVLYVSLAYTTAVHLCACGCRSEVVTPLRPDRWRLIFDSTISLRPSIGNWSFPCRSHYFIDRDRVLWARSWSDRDVYEARQAQPSISHHPSSERLRREVDIPNQRPGPDKEDVRRIRSALRRVMAVSGVVFVLSAAVRTGDPVWNSLVAVLTAVAIAVLGGCILAHVAAPSYAVDRTQATARLARLWPYISRATAWGLAAAGVGVLMSDVVPPAIRQAIETGPNALPTAGVLAVLFGTVGVAVAILEQWRDNAESSETAD